MKPAIKIAINIIICAAIIFFLITLMLFAETIGIPL